MRLLLLGLPAKLAFLAGYPALSILFVALGLGGLWGPWAVIAASGVFLSAGLLMCKPLLRWLVSSKAPYMFFWFAWMASFLAAPLAGGVFWYAGLGCLLGLFSLVLLRKWNVLHRLKNRSTHVWFVFILSAAVPTSLGLARLNHVISLFPIIAYGVFFGLLGPEVIPRVAPGVLKPTLIVGASLFLIPLLYLFLGTISPALHQYPDPMVAVLLSWIACYSI